MYLLNLQVSSRSKGNGFDIDARCLVQEPEGGFIEAPGLVQELLVVDVHAPHSPSLISPIEPPTENFPSVLQPQPSSPQHMPVPILTSTPHHSHKRPSKKPQKGPPSKSAITPKISRRRMTLAGS